MNGNLTNEQKAEMLRNAGFTAEKYINIWEQPIPFKSIELPMFPVPELPVVVADYVRAVSETTQTSPDMAATASLAVLALSLQGKYIIEGKADWREPLNLYTLVIANPAERKSAVERFMSEPVRKFEAIENKRLAPLIEQNKIEKAILENRKKYIEAKHSKDKPSDYSEIRAISEELSEFEEIKAFRLLCDDITPEKLAGILAENSGKIALLSSEGGIFDILAGRYSQSVNIDVFLKAHSGDGIIVDRQGRASENIENPALTALIFAQPNVITGLMSNETFRGRGLCGRFLYSLPKSIIGNRKFTSNPISNITAERYYNLIENLLRIENKRKIITLSEKAREVLKNIFERIEVMLADELADIGDFAGKFVGSVLRIAGLIYLAENADNLKESDLIMSESYMISAGKIGEYFLEHAKAAYQLMGADENLKNAEYILQKIIKNKLEKATKKEIVRVCRKFKSTDEMTEPLNILVNYNYLKEVQPEYKGAGRRPENIYLVNPQIF